MHVAFSFCHTLSSFESAIAALRKIFHLSH